MRLIALLQEGMPVQGISTDLIKRYNIEEYFDVTYTNCEQILRDGIQGDIFINLHGEIYPVEIEEALFAFFANGGGLFHLGGAPFETAVTFQDESWQKVVRSFGDMRGNTGNGALDMEIDYFRARLGILVYHSVFEIGQTDKKAVTQTFDRDLIASADSIPALPVRGIHISNSVPMHAVNPELKFYDSRAYMARPLCRETNHAGKVKMEDGTELASNLVLTKSWGNPYGINQEVEMKPWAIYSGEGREDLEGSVIAGMIRWLHSPCFLKPVELEYAVLHPGETACASVEIKGELPGNWQVRVRTAALESFSSVKQIDDIPWKSDEVYFDGKNKACVKLNYREGFQLVPVRFELIDGDGKIRDYSESAVVLWNEAAVKSAPRAKANGRYFDLKLGCLEYEATWVMGTNWQDRIQFAFTWHNPNPLRIARDAVDMAYAGIRFVRTHYMMPGWFRAVPGQIYESTYGDLFQEFEPGPQLKEKHMRALEAHALAFAYMGLYFMPTVYTNPSPEMGNPAHWMQTSRLFVVPGLMEEQLQFAHQVMARLGGIPSIIWDLYNESDTSMHQVGTWLGVMKQIWGDSGQMTGVGTFNMKQNMLLGEAADWHSIHASCCKTPESFRTGKPCLFQEAWVPTPATGEGEEDIEIYMSKSIAWTLRFGGAGFMPWNWNMSFMNWRYGGSFVDYWDLELGACVHADGTPRRGRPVMKNWSMFLEGLSFDQSDDRQVVFVYPAKGLDGNGSVEYLDALHREGVPFCAVNDSEVADFNFSNTVLVILPYYGMGYRRETWLTVEKFVLDGGVVWAHPDNLVLDENGYRDSQRNIYLRSGRQEYGRGFFYWNIGWNAGMGKDELKPLIALLNTLPIRKTEGNAIKLKNGKMIFKEVLSTDERSMKTDWVPDEKLPDRNIVEGIEIKNKEDLTYRTWSYNGKPVEMDGLVFSGKGQLFVLREGPGHYTVNGEEITVEGMLEDPEIRFINTRESKEFKVHNSKPQGFRADNKFVIIQKGVQKLLWVEIKVPSKRLQSDS